MSSHQTALMMLLVLASAACSAKGTGAAPSRAATTAPAPDKGSATAAPAERFEPPGADGWGQAGGVRYLERVVGGGRADQALPLVIMIHGMGDAPRFDWFRGAEAISTPMRLIMPRAPLPYYDGFSWFRYRVQDQDMAQLAREIGEAADALAHAIEILRTHRPSLGRAIVTGFSQGGMLSYALALRHPEVVAFSHPISGLLPEPLWPTDKPAGTRFPRIAAMHGDRDDLVPIDPARRLCARLSELGYEVSLREFAGVRHAVTGAMEAYTVEVLDEAARSVSEKGAR